MRELTFKEKMEIAEAMGDVLESEYNWSWPDEYINVCSNRCDFIDSMESMSSEFNFCPYCGAPTVSGDPAFIAAFEAGMKVYEGGVE